MRKIISQTANCAIKEKKKPYMSPKFRKPTQAERHAPKYLTENQIDHLIAVSQKCGATNEWIRKRNTLLIMMLFRHGLRRTEARNLHWNQINFEDAQIHIIRAKNGKLCVHPIPEREMRMLLKFKRMCPPSVYVFPRRDGGKLCDTTFRDILNKIGAHSNIPFRIHPHMFRHGCGFYLANKGIDTRAIQEYLGHRDIQNTVVYTDTAPNRFNNFWKD